MKSERLVGSVSSNPGDRGLRHQPVERPHPRVDRERRRVAQLDDQRRIAGRQQARVIGHRACTAWRDRPARSNNRGRGQRSARHGGNCRSQLRHGRELRRLHDRRRCRAMLDIVTVGQHRLRLPWRRSAGHAPRGRDRASDKGIAIGAHPSFLDLWGFGRRPILGDTPDEVGKFVIYQIGALQALAAAAGHRVTHVKLHGSLANMAQVDDDLADGVARAIRAARPRSRFRGHARAWRPSGRVRGRACAWRARSTPTAPMTRTAISRRARRQARSSTTRDAAAKRVLQMLDEQAIRTVGGTQAAGADRLASAFTATIPRCGGDGARAARVRSRAGVRGSLPFDGFGERWLAAADEGHLGRHDRHELHVGVERQVRPCRRSARPTSSTSMRGSTMTVPLGWTMPLAMRSVISVAALPMSIWPQAMSYLRPSSEVDLGEAGDGVLGRGVGDRARPRRMRGNRAVIDDPSAARLLRPS